MTIETTTHLLPTEFWIDGGRSKVLSPLYVDRYRGPRKRRSPRAHDYGELTAMIKGTLRMDGRFPFELRPPMIALVPPGYAHSEYAPHDDVETIWLGFQTSEQRHVFHQSKPQIVESQTLITLIEQLWLFATTTGGMIGPELDAQSANIVHRFLRLAREGINEPKADTLQHAVEFIAHHYVETLHMGAIAKRYGYSEGHFYRSFRDRMGITPNAYLTRLRVQHAKRMLQESSLPIKNIAALIGVPDEAYFSRLFKTQVGISPSAYRETVQ